MRRVFGLLILILLLAPGLSAGTRYLFVLSWNLRPYLDFLKGFEEESGKRPRTLTPEGDLLLLPGGDYLLVPLGHRALARVLAEAGRRKVFAALVVAPELVPQDPRLVGGIYLRLPPEVALPRLREKLAPILSVPFSLAIPYSAPENLGFAEEARRVGLIWGLSVLPLPLRGLSAFEEALSRVQVVYFVPDPFLDSEETIRSLLRKVALHRRIAVGYNRFFLKEGALLSFVVDYREAGRRAARILGDCLKGGPAHCGWHHAPVRLEVNRTQWRYWKALRGERK